MEPKIRLKGFSGEWENTSLGQAAFDFKYGINAAAKEYDGHNKYLRITDIDDSSREFCYDDLTSPNANLTNCNDYLMKVRDIVVARTGASVGKTYKYSEKDGIVYFAGFLIRFTADNDYDSDFVFYNTLTKGYDKHIKLVSQRSGQPGINVSELQSFAFNAPSLPEQRALATFFTSLDNQISAAEKRLASLKQVKAASLQAMFPQEGETTPKLRFKECDGEWKKGFIKDYCKITTGKSNTQDKVENGKYPFFIRSEEVQRSNKYLYDCEAVITIGDGNIGKVFHYINGKFDLHQRCYMMYDFKGIDVKYFYRYFSTFFYDRAIKMSAKATVDSVRLDMISDMEILYPESESEQRQIASYFTSLDRQITSQSSKISKLKQIKSACLDQMFV